MGLSESLIRLGRGANGPTKKSSIKAIFLHSNQLKNITRVFKDTRADSHRDIYQLWSSHGPYSVLKRNLNFFENFGASVRLGSSFPHYTFYNPANHIVTLSGSLRAQGTLLVPHGRPNGPKKGPSESNF